MVPVIFSRYQYANLWLPHGWWIKVAGGQFCRAEHLKIGGKIWAGGGGSTWLLNLDGCYECPLHGWQICDIGYPFNGRQICHDYMGVMNIWAAYI